LAGHPLPCRQPNSHLTQLVERLPELILKLPHCRVTVLASDFSHPHANRTGHRGEKVDQAAKALCAVPDLVEHGTKTAFLLRFTFDNSLAKGRKMTAELAKLMLRAYNAEAENCVRYVKAGNLPSAEKRLTGAATSIARYASMMEMHINPDYHARRLRELELTADYQMKVQEEREAAREERARLREEQQAERELRAERVRPPRAATAPSSPVPLCGLRTRRPWQAVGRAPDRDWDKLTTGMVPLLRAVLGAEPLDRELIELIGELSIASKRFATLWARHDVKHRSSGPSSTTHKSDR
jgi:hypothetical protein